jgi:predicted phage terminase large subunit-like protein
MSRRAAAPSVGGSLLNPFLVRLREQLPPTVGQLVTAPEISYHDFIVQYGWPVLEPGRQFIDGWHIGAICEHLEAAMRFEIKKLLINMPPRHCKSIAVSACLTPWVWTWAPIRRFFYASYDAGLSRRDSQKARDIIESPAYRERWGVRVTIKTDQNEKHKFENTATGGRFATSVGGRTTGEGGDYVICDDPHNVKDVSHDRDAKRLAVLEWWRNAIPSRLNDPRHGCFIIVAQRVHQADLSGDVLEREGGDWVHLCLPAEYVGRVYARTPLGFEDPRTRQGELLWPERFGRAELDAIKAGMLESEYQGQYQQEPAPPGGDIFKWEWFKTFASGETPRFERVVDFWDTAQSVKDASAYSVRERWGEAANGYHLLDVRRERLDYPALKAAMEEDYRSGRADAIVVEDKSSGISVIQDLQKTTQVPVIPYVVGRDGKETRARAQAATVQGGNVWVPESAPWLDAFRDETVHFPGGRYKDQVDVMVEALDWFQNGSALTQGRDMS